MSEDWPSVSIIIPNYNGIKYIEDCLRSVLRSDYPNFEVVFVDNASSDGSAEVVEKLFGSDPRLRIIRFLPQINMGASATRNEGVRLSRGNYITFLDNDTQVDRNWLRELVNVMKSDSIIGAAQSKTLKMSEPENVAGLGLLLIPYIGIPLIIGAGEKSNRYNSPFYIFAATEAMIARRDVLDNVGLFDPEIFWGENLDLSFRVWLAGYKEIVVPTSIIYHVGGLKVERQTISFESQFASDKGNILFLLKNYSLKSLLKYLPVILLRRRFGYLFFAERSIVASYSTGLLCKFGVMKFLFINFLYLIGLDFTILWCLKNLRNILKKRYVHQRLIRKVSDTQVFDYTGVNIPLHILFKELVKESRSWTPTLRTYLKKYI